MAVWIAGATSSTRVCSRSSRARVSSASSRVARARPGATRRRAPPSRPDPRGGRHDRAPPPARGLRIPWSWPRPRTPPRRSSRGRRSAPRCPRRRRARFRRHRARGAGGTGSGGRPDEPGRRASHPRAGSSASRASGGARVAGPDRRAGPGPFSTTAQKGPLPSTWTAKPPSSWMRSDRMGTPDRARTLAFRAHLEQWRHSRRGALARHPSPPSRLSRFSHAPPVIGTERRSFA